MRKPRDIDAQLKALADKARDLKARRILQLGELVAVTGADALDLDTLAGALLAAVQGSKATATKEAWSREGANFFLSRRRSSKVDPRGAASHDGSKAEADAGGDAPR